MSLAGLPDGVARADGMTGIIIFGVVYAIVAILGKIKEGQRRAGGGNPAPQARRFPEPRPKPEHPASRQPAGVRTTGTQAEATRLEDLLRVLTEAAGVPTTGGPVDRPLPLPSDEDVEERESLEVEEQILNLETDPERPARKQVDHDDDVEALVQRRIRTARDRDRPLNRADHQLFDQRIRRAAPADHTRVAKPAHPSLRQAIIWREILGPPLALRDRADSDF